MIRKHILVLLFSAAICSSHLTGQQLASWSQQQMFAYTINPAVIDPFVSQDSRVLDLDLAYRQLWTEFEGAPKTGLLGARYMMDDLNMAVGGILINDQFGPTSYSQLSAFYSYQLNFDGYNRHGLSLGLGISASQFRLDGSQIKVADLRDPLILSDEQNVIQPNASIGAFYYIDISNSYDDGTYLFGGASAEQSLPLDLTLETANFPRVIHYHGFFGVRTYYGGGWGYVEPWLWVKKVENAPISYFGGVRLTTLDQRLLGGLALSALTTDWEGHVQVGWSFAEIIDVSYAASFFLVNTFSGVRTGLSHELVVSYQWSN